VAEYQTPEFHPAFEEYCEAIYELREDDVEVIQARIAERLEISRPAVSEMIRRLEGAGPGQPAVTRMRALAKEPMPTGRPSMSSVRVPSGEAAVTVPD